MLGLILRRIMSAIPVLFLVTFGAFVMIHLSPGDAAVTAAGEHATPEQIAAAREQLGLNDSLVSQYGQWIGKLIRGDLGTSLFSSQKVWAGIWARIPVTFSLALIAVVISLVIGISAGIASGLRPRSPLDYAASFLSTICLAVPSFWLGLVLINVLALNNDVLPASNYAPMSEGITTWLSHLVMPAIALSAATTAELARQTRSGVIRVMQQDYVRTAYAKGLAGRSVVGRHVLKNAAIPVVTVFGSQLSHLLGGAIVVEAVFGMPGLGTFLIQSVQHRDYPMIQGFVVFVTLIVLTTNLLVDLTYGYLNPKVRQT